MLKLPLKGLKKKLNQGNTRANSPATCIKHSTPTACLALLVFLALVLILDLSASGYPEISQSGVATSHAFGGGGRGSANSERQAPINSRKSSSLYDCEFSYLQVDLSLIKFSIHYLVSESSGSNQSDAEFQLKQINVNATIDELVANTTLDPKLPFVFFINGFNTFAPSEEINSTWMYEVAKSFARRRLDERRAKRDEPTNETRESTSESLLARLGHFFGFTATSGDGSGDREADNDNRTGSPPSGARNAVFLTWSIPDLFASNLFSMIPAYYKTVANYDLIVDYVSGAMFKIIQFVELSNEFSSQSERLKHFDSFDFYGHSLGSHILSDAILRLVNVHWFHGNPKRPRWKFGKLTGLDPATPCFISHEHGISSERVSEAVREVAVLHSNAGFAGVPNERTNLEIVLNGGTFQPGCAWYDFTCSHVRSTDILSYMDDDCQMVAYKCTSYSHFKRGACETCQNKSTTCALVNLPEQHRDKPQVLAYAEQVAKRRHQLAEIATPRRPAANWFARRWKRSEWPQAEDSSRLNSNASFQSETKSKRTNFHYVNTNANFRLGRKSHCLQHYQLRLLIHNEEAKLREGCRPSSFLLNENETIKLRLFYEVAENLTNATWHGANRLPLAETSNRYGPKSMRSNSSAIKLNAIVRDVFFTALANFEAEPRVFVGAQLENIDLVKLANCYKRLNATQSGAPKFVLDISFMSHIEHKIRVAYSTVLCGQLNLDRSESTATLHQQQPNGTATATSLATPQDTKDSNSRRTRDLMLDLCKQSELENVSAQIDKLLDQIKLQLLDETRKVSILNSLFSLFTQWEPF